MPEQRSDFPSRTRNSSPRSFRKEPKVAIFIGVHGFDGTAKYSVAARFHRLECSLAKAREFAGFVPNSDRAPFRPLVKAGDQAIAQARHLTGIEDSNFHTIEADQAVISAQPEITILGLDYRSYRVLLQSQPRVV